MPVTNIPPVLISLGSLDATFGGNGLASTAIGAGSEQVRGIAIQPDGRYVVVGWSDTGGGNYDFAVVRFNADGSLDTSFSGDGKQTTSIVAGTSADQAYGVAIQPDGKIVVAGSTNDGTSDDFAIARYNADGSLDTSFSGDGIQTTSLSASNDGATAIAIQPDGKILAAGSSDFSFAIARYDSTGVLDATFDADGMFTGSFGSNTAVANAMALQSDGKIIIAGYGYSGASWDFWVARLTAAGAFDSTFSGDGKAFFHFNSTSSLVEEFKAIAIQSDGRILLAGRTVGTAGGDTFDAMLMRLDTNGSLDASFGGGDGMVTLNLSNWDEFDSVVVQADGKILAAGSVQTGFGEGLIARFNADGTLDTSFSGDGVFSTTFGSGTSAIYGLAIAPDGQVVAAGDSYTGTYDFGMLRLATGVPDQSAMAGSAFSYTIPADAFFDADGNPLTYTATLANDATLPAWLSFNAATRTFSGTAAVGDFGTGEVKVTASDGLASVSANFQLEVTTDFIEALRDTSHARWNDASPNGTPGTSLTFSFMDTAPSYGTVTEASTFAPMTLAEKQAVGDVLQLYQEIAGVSFTEVADAGFGGQLRFGTYLQTGTTVAAYAYSPNPAQSGGDLWVNRDTVGYGTPVSGDYSFMTLIHEVGHALGLKHPGSYGGGEPPYLATGVDNTQYTVMSYNTRADALYRDVTGATSGDIHFIDVSESTQMLYDMAAIQFIYGVNTLTRSGNDTYTFDPSIPFFKTLWDGGGADTVSVSNFTEACFIDLRDGNYSSIRMVSDPLPTGFFGGTQPTYFGIDNLAIAFGCVIENAVGGSGNDLLTGNDASNSLDGGVGNDTLTGAGGSDVFALAVSGNGIDTITDFTLGDSITVAGAAFTGAVTAGDGSAVMASQIQLAAAGGTTTLYIGTDSTAGADVQIQLTGMFAANAFASYGNTIALNSTPVGSVSITGTATQGQTLTAANTLADIDGLGTISYQWQANGSNLSGATGSAYLLTQAEVGKAISVVASYTDLHNTAESVTSSATTAVANINDAPTGGVAITGTATQGKTLTAANTLADIDGLGTISYQWQANGSNISGATGSNYLLTTTEVGKAVSVVATYTDLYGTVESVVSAATAAVTMAISAKYFITDQRGNYIDWSAQISGFSLLGKEVQLNGGAGDDALYVQAGTSADISNLGGGVNTLYLTGSLADYTQTIHQETGVYTFTRTFGLPVGKSEIVKFTVGDKNDVVYFADGHLTINAATDIRLHDGTSFQAIQAGWFTAGGTPASPVTISATTATNPAKVFIVDAQGLDVPMLPQPGQAMEITGSGGVDTVYINAGTSVNAANLGGGNDRLYLTGNLSEYTQTINQETGVYALTRSVGGQVQFTVSDQDDVVYFADGHLTINAATDTRLHDGTSFQTIQAGGLTAGGTPFLINGDGTANVLSGSAAGDTLYGNGGADIINGAAGNDTIVITDTGTTASSSATIMITSTANGTDTLIGFSAAPTANGGDVLDFTAIANLTDAVATGQTLTTDFTANNVFIFDSTPITITEAANAVATDVSVLATDGYIVLSDSANANAVTVYHSADLAGNTGVETALVILSGVNITQLTAGNLLV